MKILHITDSHGTVKGPEGRRDVYYITFLRKLYELGYVIKREKIDMVIHTGDLFHTARVSDKFAGQVSEMIKAWQVPVYVVPGNHDIEGYTTDTIDQTKLGLLSKTGVINLLDRDHPVSVTAIQDGEEYTVAISGQEYYAHIDEGNMQDFEMQQDEADFNILAIHGYIADTLQHPNIKCTMCNDVLTNADVILTGHYHRQFEWNGPDFDIYNPGSMMRVEQTEYNKTHKPMYGILDIQLTPSGAVGYSYKFHEFRIAQPSTTVFDYESKYKAKTTSITLDGFKNSIANTMAQVQPSLGILQIINDVCTKGNVAPDVAKKAVDVYNDTLQAIPDEFEVQPGFIESQQQKTITKVILKNFQSHKDTTVEFDSGLNIIVGESNNGKTSILRGIMWAIDNQPLGTDFIMAGENECSVEIDFSDGTSIKRGRTIKDTGYYEIKFFDDNGNLQTAQYRGFTNAVPVEVVNVHQMPKVNITKDIETHLNVLSQLDGPFLLTESPLVKASAIGRITGTHVIDAAIKESNKTIQANKKLIKSYTEDLAVKDNELKALPDIKAMERFSNGYTLIVNQIKSLDGFVKQINGYIAQVGNLNCSIASETVRYKQGKYYASFKPIVDNALKKLNDIVYLDGKLNEYNTILKSIDLNQENLINAKYRGNLKQVLDKASTCAYDIQVIDSALYSVNECDTKIEYNKTQSSLNTGFASSIKSVIAHCNILVNYISTVNPRCESVDELGEQQRNVCTMVAKGNKLLESLKTDIVNTRKEKSNFIYGTGYCPCCGQHITDEHVPHIIEFMEGM